LKKWEKWEKSKKLKMKMMMTMAMNWDWCERRTIIKGKWLDGY
jgi:hypothetical protein